MASQLGAHQTEEAYVVSLSEDFCKAPGTPVGYMISQKLSVSERECCSVRGHGTPMLNMSSRISSVLGNEAGTGGGVVSGANMGMCKPIENFAPKVRAEGNNVVRHDTLMQMNCSGPDSEGNVIGKIVYLKNNSTETESADSVNEFGGKHYSSAEVTKILLDIKDKNLFESFFDHFGNGKYDFKIKEPSATFDVYGRTMNSGEFGNFLAGFAGQVNGGIVGTSAVKLGGIAYDATDTAVYNIKEFLGLEHALPPGSDPPQFDLDEDSIGDIELGIYIAKKCPYLGNGEGS